ncbi:ArsR family transcriptional regulator [Halobacteriales archaeon Cl-PHB]
MSDDRLVETVDPADAFGALADDTRVDVLRALWEADDQTAPFSDLREAVGMRDSGQFNYHLGKLTGQFVRKTDDGYELSHAGRHVVGSLLAGSYTMTGDIDPIPFDEPCRNCGQQRTFHYEDERVRVDCEGCDFYTLFEVPPGVFADHDPEEFIDVAERYLRQLIAQNRKHFCTYCEGHAPPKVLPAAETADDGADVPEELADHAMARNECQRCGMHMTMDLAAALFDRPEVVAFYHDHGIDVQEASFFQLHSGDTNEARIVAESPLRATVTYQVGGDSLTLTVDDDLDVRQVERA